jgi:hypothetical protein
MKLFNRKNKVKEPTLQEQIDSLKKEIYGEPDKKDLFNSFYSSLWSPFYTRATLKSRVDDFQGILKKQEKLTHMILEHMKLEYVKITEEDGQKVEKEILRPITKKKLDKKNKVEKGNCDCCDYAD